MAMDPVIRCIEILDEMAATVAASLIENGVVPDIAREAAERAAERVWFTYRGQHLYIPSGLGYTLARRNAEIRRRLAAGESRAAIMREFNISDVQLFRILADDSPSRR